LWNTSRKSSSIRVKMAFCIWVRHRASIDIERQGFAASTDVIL
jgi:hypothetical protein